MPVPSLCLKKFWTSAHLEALSHQVRNLTPLQERPPGEERVLRQHGERESEKILDIPGSHLSPAFQVALPRQQKYEWGHLGHFSPRCRETKATRMSPKGTRKTIHLRINPKNWALFLKKKKATDNWNTCSQKANYIMRGNIPGNKKDHQRSMLWQEYTHHARWIQKRTI